MPENASVSEASCVRPPDGGTFFLNIFLVIMVSVHFAIVFSGYGWVIVASIFFNAFLSFGVVYSIGIFFEVLIRDLGCSPSEMSIVASIAFSLQCFLGPIVSILLQRFGSRCLSVAGALLTSLSFITSAFAPNVVFLYFSLGILAGTGLALLYLPSIILTTLYFLKRRSLATALGSIGAYVGCSLLPYGLRFLISYYDWRGAMFITGGLMLNSVPICILLRPLETKVKRQLTKEESVELGESGYLLEPLTAIAESGEEITGMPSGKLEDIDENEGDNDNDSNRLELEKLIAENMAGNRSTKESEQNDDDDGSVFQPDSIADSTTPHTGANSNLQLAPELVNRLNTDELAKLLAKDSKDGGSLSSISHHKLALAERSISMFESRRMPSHDSSGSFKKSYFSRQTSNPSSRPSSRPMSPRDPKGIGKEFNFRRLMSEQVPRERSKKKERMMVDNQKLRFGRSLKNVPKDGSGNVDRMYRRQLSGFRREPSHARPSHMSSFTNVYGMPGLWEVPQEATSDGSIFISPMLATSISVVSHRSRRGTDKSSLDGSMAKEGPLSYIETEEPQSRFKEFCSFYLQYLMNPKYFAYILFNFLKGFVFHTPACKLKTHQNLLIFF